ncbi:MAG: PTS sugar transporter subunit IIA [Planctomycetota bacterium]|jgi:mannitol/fructose-specific phosphotransferase system IIA component (Ntr-type)
MALHEYCIPGAILPELEAADKEDAIRQMVDALVSAKALTAKKADAIGKEIIERERQATTGIGNGVGIPHARSDNVDKIILTFGRVDTGIDYAAVDGERVRVLVLLVSPKDATDEHLAAMKSIVGIIRDGYQCKRLIGCRSAESFVDLLKELDGVKS